MKHKHPIAPIIKMREQKLIDILGYFSQVYKSYIATATLPFVFPNKVLGVIPLVSTTAYGGVSSNITGSYATAVCSFAAVRGNNTIVFKVDKPLNAAFPSDTSVSALIIGR